MSIHLSPSAVIQPNALRGAACSLDGITFTKVTDAYWYTDKNPGTIGPCISTGLYTLDIDNLRREFRLNAKLGRLYRGTHLVEGTAKFRDGPLVLTVGEKQVAYARVCYAIYHGYFPKQVRHRNGKPQDNRIENLYDPARVAAEAKNGAVLPHAGKYRGVYSTKCQYSGRFRGYRGAVYSAGRRHYTPVVETPEMARDLLLLLTAQLEWQAAQ